MATDGTLQQWKNTATGDWKQALVQSFEGFSASQISQNHIEKARQCIRNGGSRHERYTLVPFERILNDNQVSYASLVLILHKITLLIKKENLLFHFYQIMENYKLLKVVKERGNYCVIKIQIDYVQPTYFRCEQNCLCLQSSYEHNYCIFSKSHLTLNYHKYYQP